MDKEKKPVVFRLKLDKETRNCYAFTCGSRDTGDLITVYLHKSDIDAAGIDPCKGIKMTVEEAEA